MNHNTEIIRDRNKAPRLHIKPWDETVCSVELLNPKQYMSIQPYRMSTPGFEYDVILSRKPDSNVIAMRMDTSGLDFFYQPPLTLQEKAEGCRRPPKVVGSYAVYHKTMAGDYTRKGGKNYRTGKALHLYRPRPVDAKGRWCWADLRVFPEANLLTVTIPWVFLENCTYPVHHAAGLEFGYKAVGGSEDGDNANTLRLCLAYAGGTAPATPASNGTLTSISCYTRADELGPTMDPAIYADSTGTPTTRLDYVLSGGTAVGLTDAWVTTALTGSVSLTASTQYWLGFHNGGTGVNYQWFKYDATGGANEQKLKNDGSAWPTPWSQDSEGQRRRSIYAIYAGAAAATTPTVDGVATPSAVDSVATPSKIDGVPA